MKITILGGKNEIGGNKILLEHKGTKILLDFGLSFRKMGEYFSEFLNPRGCAGLTDYFELGILPDMTGVYREDILKHMGRPAERKEVDAVLLSHAHADHAQLIHFLRTDIPIFCTEATRRILKSLEETGADEEYITCCEKFVFYINQKGELSRVNAGRKEYLTERQYKIITPYEKVNIGSLEVEMLPVDHSMPGACGFIVHSDEGSLVYTGDIRFHGLRSELSRKFVERAVAAKPKWLITEGTRISSDERDSEAEVKEKISKFISDAKGLVFAEHPIRDLDRARSFVDAAKENKRQFVVGLKLAHLIETLGDLSPVSLDELRIFIPRKSWGLITKENAPARQIPMDYKDWERSFLGRGNAITYKELQRNPAGYVVSLHLWDINNLIDIQPKDAVWIKSSCEPFCIEMELDEKRKQNWLEHFGIKEVGAHASGHASGPEIKEMIRQIAPKKLISVHTEHPEAFG